MLKKQYSNDLIRYVYGETTQEQNQLLESEIFRDEYLEEELFDLLDLTQALDELVTAPRQQVVRNVLAFSASYNHNRTPFLFAKQKQPS